MSCRMLAVVWCVALTAACTGTSVVVGPDRAPESSGATPAVSIPTRTNTATTAYPLATQPAQPATSATVAVPTESTRGSSMPSSPVVTAPARPSSNQTPSPPTRQPTGVVSTLPTTAKLVALTFDGGADSRGASSILATLRREGVPATFFVTGRFAAANPALVKDLAGVGPVGNHSWDHPPFPTLSDGQVASQIDRTRAAIIAVTGHDPTPFFRFPFGESDAHTRTLVGAKGYQAVGWTVDSLGWKGTSGGMTASKVVDRVVAAARPGEIVLMHLGANPDDNTTLDADALPRIIERLRGMGYRFVTLESQR